MKLLAELAFLHRLPLPDLKQQINIFRPEADNPVKNETNAPADKAKSEAFKLIFWFVLLIGLYGVAGWYLIRDGKYLFAVLNREEANGEEKQVPQVTSLNL